MNQSIKVLLMTFFTIIFFQNVYAFSWKDITLGKTTEKELVKHIGKPRHVEMFYDDYNKIDTYKPSTKFHYGWHKLLDNMEIAKKDKPHTFLKLFPLTLDYISGWSGDFHFQNYKLDWYQLDFSHEPKYKNLIMEDIKTLFGRPSKLERLYGGIIYQYETFKIIFGDESFAVLVQDYSALD